VDSVPVDFVRLAEWMDAQGLESGPISGAIALKGGTQNVIVRFDRGASQFVLRKPSAHLRANSNETMLREARVLCALAGSEVPHPGLIAACSDTGVLGSTFYLMEPIAGFSAPAGLPRLHASDAGMRHRMGLALVEASAMLSGLDYVKAGLADFGKAEGFLERQTARWRSQLETYGTEPGWPGPRGLPGVEMVGQWLGDTIPASRYRPGLIHGDYHVANVLYHFDSPELAAIVDWELATIGDPLLDLGWLLALWPDDDGNLPDPEIAIEPWSGFPATSELVAHYGRFSTRDLSIVPWFAVLACYKLGIILEGTHARACAGRAQKEMGDRLHAVAVRLFERAQQWIGRVS
jgi:aminoglycoside phosphotransferase (APT) family kinase protein